MECSRFNELFSEYIDGTLDDIPRRMLEEHLAVCGRCAEELRELRACVSALGSLNTVQAPADFLNRVHERIQIDDPVPWLEWLREKLFFPVRVKIPLGATGLVMAALLVVFIYQGTRQRAGPVPVPALSPAPAPTAMKPQQQLETRPRDQEQLALKQVPAPPSSETAVDSGAPGRLPTPAEETRPLQLALVIGYGEKRGMMFAEKEKPRQQDDMVAEVPRTTSMAAPEQKTLSPPSASQPARPAGPSAAGRGMISPRLKTTETPPGKRGPADARVERDDRSTMSYTHDKKTEPSAGVTTAPDMLGKRETMVSSKAPAEIEVLVGQLGGFVEATKYKDLNGRPESLTVRIPTASLSRFLDELRRIGRLRSPAEARADISGNTTILVQITLE